MAPGLGIGVLMLLAGCGFSEDALWPSITGELPEREELPAVQQSTTSAYRQLPPLVLGSSSFRPGPVEGTEFETDEGEGADQGEGAVVANLRRDLSQLHARMVSDDNRFQIQRTLAQQLGDSYRELTIEMRDMLADGATIRQPGPAATWVHGQGQLQQLNGTMAGFDRLAAATRANQAVLAEIERSAQAASALQTGSTSERAEITALDRDMNRTGQLLTQMGIAIGQDSAAIRRFLFQARNNQGAFLGDDDGTQLLQQAYGVSALAPAGAAASRREPLVVVRFDEPGVDYQSALANAVSAVLAQQPEASFDLLLVEPSSLGAAVPGSVSGGTSVPAERVLQTLADLGLPPERIDLVAVRSPYAAAEEFQLFLR